MTTYIKSNQQMSYMGTFSQLDTSADGALHTTAFSSSFCSHLFDSGSCDTEWDELHLHVSEGIKLQLYIWTFHDAAEAADYQSSTHAHKLALITLRGKAYEKQDVLLYSFQQTKGRYLVFALLLYDETQIQGVFQAFEISYPARRMVQQYMPQVYHDQWYEEQYFSVFKDLLVSLEEKISSFYLELNIEICEDTKVIELLSWMGLDGMRQYAALDTLRALPAFLKQQSHQGSESYCKALFQFLFHEDVVFHVENQQLLVYVRANEDNKLEKMLLFLNKEIPFILEPHLQVVQHACLDLNAYCGVTSILSSISGMDDSCLNQQYLV